MGKKSEHQKSALQSTKVAPDWQKINSMQIEQEELSQDIWSSASLILLKENAAFCQWVWVGPKILHF
jgi:hypothetical protein